MTEADSLELIKNGESITVEFKKSTNEIMYTENANRAHGHGMLELSSFQPFPKNNLLLVPTGKRLNLRLGRWRLNGKLRYIFLHQFFNLGVIEHYPADQVLV